MKKNKNQGKPAYQKQKKEKTIYHRAIAIFVAVLLIGSMILPMIL